MEAGTKMKNFFSRLLSAEKVATNLFNQQMALNNVQYEGKILDYNALSKLARTDLPKAVELVSKLYKTGKLNDATLQKMFTARHFLDIQSLLSAINGDVDSFVKGISKGVDYSNDLYKAMFNISEQSKQLGNNIKAFMQPILQEGENSLTGLAMMLNDSLKNMDNTGVNKSTKTINQLSLAMGAGVTQSLALNGAIGLLAPTIAKGATSLKGLLGALGIGVGGGAGAVIAGLAVALTALNYILVKTGDNAYQLQKDVADTTMVFQGLDPSISKANNTVEKFSNSLDILVEKLKESKNVDIKSYIESVFNANQEIMKGFKEYNEGVEGLFRLDPVDTESLISNLDPTREKIEQLKNSISELTKSLSDLKYETINSQLGNEDNLKLFKNTKYFYKNDNIKRNIIHTQGQFAYDKYIKDQISVADNQLSGFLQEFLSIIETETDTEKALQKARKIGLEKYNFLDEKSIDIALSGFDLKDINLTKDKLAKQEEILAKEQDDFNNKSRDLSERLQKGILAQDKWAGVVNQQHLKLYESYGKVFDGDNLLSGWEAIYHEVDKSIPSIGNSIIKAIDEDISMYTAQLANASEDTELYKTIENRKKDLEKYREIIQEKTKKNIYDLLDETEKSFLNSLSLDKRSMPLISQYLNMSLTQSIIGEEDSQSYKGIEEAKKITKQILVEENERAIAKKNQNKYSLKHISYQKEELEMELALAKVGRTRGEQLALDYEYKLKTYKINKDLIDSEVDDARDKLKELTGGAGGSIIKRLLEVDPSDTKEAQTVLKEFESQYKRQGQGEFYKDLTEAQKAGDIYVKSLLKAKKELSGLEVEIANSFDETMKYVGTLNPYEKMFEFSGKDITKYKEKVSQIFEDSKKEVWNAYDLGNLTIDEAVMTTYQELLLLKQMMVTEEGKLNLIKQLGLKDDEEGLTAQEQLMVYYKQIEKKYDDINTQKENELKKEKQLLEIEKYRLKVYNNIGDVIGKLGETLDSDLLGNLGGVFDSISLLNERSEDKSKNFKWDFKDMNWDQISVELSKAFESAFDHMSSGGAIGSFVGNIVGNSRVGQQFGTLAGLGTGLYGGFDPATSMAIQAGASLLGGLFGDNGDDQAEADARSREANKIYNKNTEALQELAQRMSELSGGVDNLNSSLISSFSKLPTVGNLDRVTDAMTSMYKTMEKTRIFNEVAYQVTKTKSSKGFLGIGGGSTSWTETISVSVEEMLNKYGFKGAIQDMTTDELRSFSKWLDDFDMGDSDNFSVLSDAISDYAEALDKMESNIENFFYDTTMESFEGISSLQQEDLRQQIEDFYKNLGLQIDDKMLEQIDKLAEEMSVMVKLSPLKNLLNCWETLRD